MGRSASRGGDTAGLGMGYAQGQRRPGRARPADGFLHRRLCPGTDRRDFLELTYQYQLTPAVQLQPDFQYVFNPGGGIANPESSQPIDQERSGARLPGQHHLLSRPAVSTASHAAQARYALACSGWPLTELGRRRYVNASYSQTTRDANERQFQQSRIDDASPGGRLREMALGAFAVLLAVMPSLPIKPGAIGRRAGLARDDPSACHADHHGHRQWRSQSLCRRRRPGHRRENPARATCWSTISTTCRICRAPARRSSAINPATKSDGAVRQTAAERLPQCPGRRSA